MISRDFKDYHGISRDFKGPYRILRDLKNIKVFKGLSLDFIRSQGISLRGMSCISWISLDLISLGGISAFQGFSGNSS